METKKVKFLLQMFQGKFSPNNMSEVNKILQNSSDDKYALFQTMELKDPNMTLVLSVFGFDRIYIEDYGIGVIKILTFIWTFIIWWIIDLPQAKKKTFELNFKKFKMLADCL